MRATHATRRAPLALGIRAESDERGGACGVLVVVRKVDDGVIERLFGVLYRLVMGGDDSLA